MCSASHNPYANLRKLLWLVLVTRPCQAVPLDSARGKLLLQAYPPEVVREVDWYGYRLYGDEEWWPALHASLLATTPIARLPTDEDELTEVTSDEDAFGNLNTSMVTSPVVLSPCSPMLGEPSSSSVVLTTSTPPSSSAAAGYTPAADTHSGQYQCKR